MAEEYEAPTPTQEQLNAIKRGEHGVTDTPKADDEQEKTVESDKPATYKTRQAKAD